MIARDWQTLFGLMLDGAVARSGAGDQFALDLPASLMAPLRATLSPPEYDRLCDGIELDRLEREAAKRKPGDVVTIEEAEALLAQAG